jgi:hypothetical protein
VNVEVQAIALQWMKRERAMAEQLLQAKAQVAELRAEIRIRDAALEAKDATQKANLESELQSKEAALQAQIFGRYAAPGKQEWFLFSAFVSPFMTLDGQCYETLSMLQGQNDTTFPFPTYMDNVT